MAKSELGNVSVTLNGVVKFFNEAKGFGFITEKETGKDYFVHVTGLVDKIERGDQVVFDTMEGKKGVMAVNVKYVATTT